MVGRIGSILGRENVNSVSMHVGRRIKRERAIVVLVLPRSAAVSPNFFATLWAALIGSEHGHSTYGRRVPRPRAHSRVRHHVVQAHS
jgi:hypothetical protein